MKFGTRVNALGSLPCFSNHPRAFSVCVVFGRGCCHEVNLVCKSVHVGGILFFFFFMYNCVQNNSGVLTKVNKAQNC